MNKCVFIGKILFIENRENNAEIRIKASEKEITLFCHENPELLEKIKKLKVAQIVTVECIAIEKDFQTQLQIENFIVNMA